MHGRSRRISFCSTAVLLGAWTSTGSGQGLEGPGFGVDYDSVEVRLTHVAGRVHMLEGAGGNLGVFVADDGVFLVDGQFAPLTDRILAEIRRVSTEPVRFLINTHFHGDHTGGNENFGPAGALIVAHENVRRTLAQPHYIEMVRTRWPSFGPEALPVVTFRDSVTFHLGGERIDVIHAPPSHTDGDSVIYFRGSDAIHMGDIYRTRGQPIFDRNNGGSYEGLIAASDFVLDLIGEDTKIVPGHGAISTRADLREVRDIMATVRDRIQAGIDAGRTVEEVIAADPSAGFGWRDGRLTVEETVRWIYTELAASR
jgi:glyoxylase-like metal-dependent hydrolase (beta-lactamase superfamily II)